MPTIREQAILESLCRRVRILSLPLVVAGWGAPTRGSQERLRPNLKRLVEAGWLTMFDTLANPLVDLDRPLTTWSPDQSAADFDTLAKACCLRWTGAPQPVRVYLAGPRAVTCWGGRLRQRIRHLGQVTHDLHVAAVYVRYLTSALSQPRFGIGR